MTRTGLDEPDDLPSCPFGAEVRSVGSVACVKFVRSVLTRCSLGSCAAPLRSG